MTASLLSLRSLLAATVIASSASLSPSAAAQATEATLAPAETGAPQTASRLTQVSVRALTGANGQAAVFGFLLANPTGASSGGTMNLLVRGVGPTLSQFGVANALSAPVLTCTDDGAQVPVYDGWNSGDPAAAAGLELAFDHVGAFALPPESGDVAYMSGFNIGDPYTVQLASASGATGVVLGEIYDLDDPSAAASLVNFSGLAQVGTGADVLTAGFAITGGTSMTLLVRGVGPGLGQFGESGLLPHPQLSVYDCNGMLVAQNIGWNDDVALASIFAQVGAFALPAGSTDAALLVTLAPGTYSAQLADTDGATGQGLIEIYVVP